MDILVNQINENFGLGPIPKPALLVINDGFDVLEKERGVKFFSKKSWENVYDWLINGGQYYLEELGCLDVKAIEYYLRAYFDYSFETLEAEDVDDDFLMFLFSEFYQLKYMKKYDLLAGDKRQLITKFAELVKHHDKIQKLDTFGENFVLEAIGNFENYR